MPTATQKDAPKQEALVSKVPSSIPKSRKEPIVVSKSRRSKLNGAVTQVELMPDGKYVVSGDGLKRLEFTKFQTALRYARTGEEPK